MSTVTAPLEPFTTAENVKSDAPQYGASDTEGVCVGVTDTLGAELIVEGDVADAAALGVVLRVDAALRLPVTDVDSAAP